MVRYMKCPRCELNYIDAEKQEYCDVCLKEMKGIRTDADEIEEEEEGEIPTELCPVCGENMMMPGEKMCEECRKKAEMEESPSSTRRTPKKRKKSSRKRTKKRTSTTSRATRSIPSATTMRTTKRTRKIFKTSFRENLFAAQKSFREERALSI